MAQSDWTILSDNSGSLIGGADGTAIQHVSMSNPLTSSGEFCRIFHRSEESGNASRSIFKPTNLTSSVSGFSYSKAHSMRCWARVKQTYSANDVAFFMEFKAKSDFDKDTLPPYATPGIPLRPDAYYNYGTGYGLMLKPGSLTFRASPYSGYGSGSADDKAYSAPDFLSLTADRWHRLRMDVIPIVSGSIDIVNIYTGSENDTWTQVLSVNIPTTKVGAYIPWNDGTYGHFGFAIYNYGFIDNAVYVDKFEYYEENI